MADRRNPYLILGLDYGASPQQAQAAFARLSRRLRTEPDAQYRIEDATWALHQIEHAAEPGVDLHVFRVPADPEAYTYQTADGILSVAPQNLPRRTGSSAPDVARMQAEIADQLTAAGLREAVGAWAPPAPRPMDAVEDAAVRPVRRYDPFAVALGNATLLGVGYLLMRRWSAAFAALSTTAVLVLLVAVVGQPNWFWRGVLALWWVSTTIHGIEMSRTRNAALAVRPPVQGGRPARVTVQRLVAIGVATALGAGIALTAIEGGRALSAAAAAHEAGNCDEAVQTLRGVSIRHLVVDPFLGERADSEMAACLLLTDALAEDDPTRAAELLAQYLNGPAGRWTGAPEERADRLLTIAGAALTTALDRGDLDQLETGFDALATVLAEAPASADRVDEVLTGYLDGLVEADPCTAMAQLDWLGERRPSGDQLDRVAGEIDAIAPPVLLACGDQLVTSNGKAALATYETLLTRYPDHDLASDARKGVDAAEARLELEEVIRLVGGSEPRYCSEPAPYRAAPPWKGGGPHRILPLGSSEFASGVPSEWRGSPENATLVVCAEGPSTGDHLRSCAYQGGHTVSLRRTTFAVKVYELRTGALVRETTLSYGGSCPLILEWRCPALIPNCPPPAQIRAAYSSTAIRNSVSPWVFR